MFFRLAIILLALPASRSAAPFELSGFFDRLRANPHNQYFVWLPGENSAGTDYDDMFIAATERWTQTHPVPFAFDIVIEERAPCIPYPDPSIYSGMAANPGVVAWAPSRRDDDGLISMIDCYRTPGPAGARAYGTAPTGGIRFALLPDGRTPSNLPATHEIGHTLGLGHSVVAASVMMNDRKGLGELRHLIGRPTITSDDICGLAVIHGVMEECTVPWQYATTLTGAPTTAMFIGGATTDFGLTYTGVAAPSDHIEVYGTFVTDTRHAGMSMRLHVIAESAGAMHALVGPAQDAAVDLEWARPRWAPIDLDENPVIPAAESIAGGGWWNAGAAHDLLIFSASLLQLYGGYHRNVPDSLSVRFWLAYSLDDIPDEYFYSPTPIELEWRK